MARNRQLRAVLWCVTGLGLLLLSVSGCGTPTAEPPSAGQRSASASVSKPEQTGVAASQAIPAARQAAPLPRAASHVSDTQAGPEPTPSAAWQQWYEAARDSPEVTMRVQALEQWAQRPGDPLDPVTYGLVDPDETVRSRAQALYEQYLAREEGAPAHPWPNEARNQ